VKTWPLLAILRARFGLVTIPLKKWPPRRVDPNRRGSAAGRSSFWQRSLGRPLGGRGDGA